jgi:signal peptidase II
MTAKHLLYDWGGGNVWLFHAINAQQPSWLDDAMSFATRVGDYWNFPLLLVIWALAVWHSRRVDRSERTVHLFRGSLRFAASGVLLFLFTSGLKLGFDMPRPVVVLAAGSVRVLGRPELHYSLPSGHSAFVIIVAASMWSLVTWPWRIGLIAMVVLVGVSRIWLGAHFPVDVLVGYGIGLFSAALAARIVRYYTTPISAQAEYQAENAQVQRRGTWTSLHEK